MRFVNTLQEIIARQMRGEGQQEQTEAAPRRRGMFGRMSLPQPLSGLASMAGGGYEPGNPHRASLGDFPDANGYSPPSYGDDLQMAGAQRTPLSSALMAVPPMLPPSNGIGGPQVVSRGMAPPSAPAGLPLAQRENQAFRDARQRAQAGIAQDGYPTFRSESMIRAGNDLSSAIEAARAAQAEQARREGVTFDQWWRFRGRQDANAPPARPFDLNSAYRFHSPPKRPPNG